MTTPHLSLALALDGAGWHPAAWREPGARPAEIFGAQHWVDLIQEAERGLIDFVTIEDALSLQSSDPNRPDGRVDQVRGRLDAVLIASRVAPVTEHIGLVPTAVVTHTEPFHLSKAIATLDYLSQGRAGVRLQVSYKRHEAAHFNRREIQELDLANWNSPENRQVAQDLFDEAADYAEVLRRLWDSWEDDAEIRDAETGRFIDRERLHYIDFAGRWFSVKGPSITPRPPQGQPVITVLGHDTIPYRLGAQAADVLYITPKDAADARRILAEVAFESAQIGREGADLRVFADLVVLLDEEEGAARRRLDWLNDRADQPYQSDALIFAGTAAGLADLLAEWRAEGIAGFRLRPAALPHDLRQVTEHLVPELQRRGLFKDAYSGTTLRDHLGLSRPASRYAAAAGTAARTSPATA